MRFNFRGTGASHGHFDEGHGESDDLRAVARWVREQRPDAQLWLAGFSFGAYVTIKCAAELQPGMLISIAPPAAGRSWDFSTITLPDCPWLVIQGDADEIVDPQAVYDWVDSLTHLPPAAGTGAHARHQPLLPSPADGPARRDQVRRASYLPHSPVAA